MTDPIIIKACLNGGRDRTENPHIPWTPAEVAAEAQRCYEAGASIVHFHARTPDGGPSHDAAWYREAGRLIRARTPLLINHTLTREPGVPVGVALDHLRHAPPHMCALPMGYQIRYRGAPGARTTRMIAHSYEDIAAVLAVCREIGVVPEIGIDDLGFLNTTMTFVRDGLLPDPRLCLLEISGAEWGDGRAVAPGTPQNYLLLRAQIRTLLPNLICLTQGFGPGHYRTAAMGIACGDGVRVGFEDCVYRPDGSVARSNADLVEWAVLIAGACGRTPATPDEVRGMVGLG